MEKIELTQAQKYSNIMKFIDNTKDIELLKDIIVELIDNSSDQSAWLESYDDHQEKIEKSIQ